MPKTYNTPKRTFVVKTRLTEEEHDFFMERMKNYEMSQSEFIRQAIDGAVVKPIIRVNPVNDEVLATLGKLIAEYGKIGNNINQIARTLNEWRNHDWMWRGRFRYRVYAGKSPLRQKPKTRRCEKPPLHYFL